MLLVKVSFAVMFVAVEALLAAESVGGRIRGKIGIVFQVVRLVPRRSALDNVLLRGVERT